MLSVLCCNSQLIICRVCCLYAQGQRVTVALKQLMLVQGVPPSTALPGTQAAQTERALQQCSSLVRVSTLRVCDCLRSCSHAPQQIQLFLINTWFSASCCGPADRCPILCRRPHRAASLRAHATIRHAMLRCVQHL